MNLSMPRLLAELADNPASVTRQPEHWRQMRRWWAPWHGALAAMYDAGLTVRQIRALRLQDVSDDASAVTIDGIAIPITPAARVLVETQRLVRQQCGAGPEHILMAWEEGGRPYDDQTLVRALMAIPLDTDMPFATGEVARTSTSRHRRVGSDTVAVARVGTALPSVPPAEEPPVAPATHRQAGAVLNGALMRQRRSQLALSPTQVGQHMGVGRRVVERLEAGGDAQELTLRQLTSLARCLGATPADLLADDNTDDDGRPAPPGDAAAVGAAVLTCGRAVATTTIAQVCGWSLSRTHQAIDELADVVSSVGMTVHVNNSTVALLPSTRSVDHHRAKALERSEIARRGLTRRDLENLSRAASGRRVRTRKANAISLNRLRLAHVIEGNGDSPQLTADVRYGLMRDT